MEKEKLESLLIDYIDGVLVPADKDRVEAMLKNDPEAHKLYQQLKELIRATEQPVMLMPGAALKNSFDQLLAREIKVQSKITERPVVLYRMAAAIVLLLLAGLGGYWVYRDAQYKNELAALREEVKRNKHEMLTKLGNEHSASQRMLGVSVAYEIPAPDDDVVQALVSTLNTDPNTNVRMAALDALGNFYREPLVRKSLVESLKEQKDPVVQIALIRLLVRMKEGNIVDVLENITRNAQTMKAVKDEAYSGILKLS